MLKTIPDNIVLIDEYLPINIHVYLYADDWRRIQKTSLGNFFDNFTEVTELLKHPNFITRPKRLDNLIKCYKERGGEFMIGNIVLINNEIDGTLTHIEFGSHSYVYEEILWKS